ncbi:prolyl hydroxylase family protein [Bacillus halotolerans]|uniref:prolyl hydroxylase family protein n=1 Tax=Bacillus halotolerans TaxID=260554 RepID=UPI00192A7226|nr:2OG-Fe(II) oxygenase [Bacillus halotolerans]MBL4963932.1 2OG-Fe(II) oxygenase [Bacillus halotolerans]
MPPPNYLHDDPFIACFEQVAIPTECRELIKLAESKLMPSTVLSERGEVYSQRRISEQVWLPHQSQAIVYQLSQRIAAIVDRPINHAEHLQIARYQIGGKFDVHSDCYDLNTVAGREAAFQNGQRIVTAMLYLNTPDMGGETFFPELNLQISPSEGKLLVFENCKRGSTEPHPCSIHAGLPVKKGQKWIANLWFCQDPFVW